MTASDATVRMKKMVDDAVTGRSVVEPGDAFSCQARIAFPFAAVTAQVDGAYPSIAVISERNTGSNCAMRSGSSSKGACSCM